MREPSLDRLLDAGTNRHTRGAAASARDAPTLWHLRFEIRGTLVAYIRAEHSDTRPALRIRVEAPDVDRSCLTGVDGQYVRSLSL